MPKIEDIKRGGIYQHYKGKNYRVLELAMHSESEEWMVVYECLYPNEVATLWVRPLSMFIETIILDGVQIPRFKYIGDQKGSSRL
jgi:hypothetical protein